MLRTIFLLWALSPGPGRTRCAFDGIVPTSAIALGASLVSRVEVGIEGAICSLQRTTERESDRRSSLRDTAPQGQANHGQCLVLTGTAPLL